MKPQPTPVKRSVPLAIADDVRMRIESGELSAGEPVPTIQQLCETWSCTVGAAREAHRLLKEQGLVTGGRGKPLSVRTPVRQALRSSTRHQIEKNLAARSEEERAKVGTAELETGVSFVDEIQHQSLYEVIPANEDLAEAFNVDVGTKILQRTYEARIARTGVLNSWSLSFLPVEIIGQNADYMDAEKEPWAGGTQYQLRTLGIEIGEIIDEVTGRMPTTAEREDWHMDLGVPMLVVRRISIDTADRVVEVSDANFPADRTKLSFVTPLKPWSE